MRVELLAEWDYEKNGSIDPLDISDHSYRKCYWKCPNGHPSYYTSIIYRLRGCGCPVCSNHKIIKGINDFECLHPELMDEWMWEENNTENLKPDAVSQGSGRIAWWKCRICGNTWKASIVNRARKHSGCPYCANLKVKKGFNDLASVKPELAKEWDYEKNGDLTPDSVVAFYSKKVWWKCSKCGNSWQSSQKKKKKTGCPYCPNHKKIKGFNDFETKFPEIAKEWDYEKNEGILPSQFASGSEKKVWWTCEKGHSWKAQINTRVKGGGCPVCSNHKIIKGVNDLFTTNPELADEWDFTKNNKISPFEVPADTTRKAWWICKDCGYSWSSSINSRANGRGCPECGKVKNQVGRMKSMAAKNPLFEIHPELEKEWDYEKNSKVDVSLLAVSSNKYAWWRCEKGHSYRTRISSRTLKNVGCPYCHNQKVLTGINDLQTLNPELADEWDCEKNAPLKPSMVFSHGSKSVWWKCPLCGNSWKAKINNRANGRSCPNCNPNGTSFIEQTIFFYVKSIYADAENRFIFDKVEYDIYIPSIRTAIEYDGSYYHSSEKSFARDNKKDLFSKENNIRLIRLREKPLGATSDAINISCDCSNWEKLGETCEKIIRFLDPEKPIDVSIKRDYPAIIGSKREQKKENAFGKMYPNLLKEWDYEKNAPLDPDNFSRGSNVKVWWICKEGHSWQAQISNRCNGSGCPLCFDKRRKTGLNRKKEL